MKDALRIALDLTLPAVLLLLACHWASLGLRAGDTRVDPFPLESLDAASPAEIEAPAPAVPDRDFVRLAGLDA